MCYALPFCRAGSPDRAILQLQYGQGMTGAQIAAALGLHAATVRQRSRRARQKLKQLLEQEGLTL
ncbi:MAG: sigma factor-like helix-turn-helix DNA-binding protein [Gemmiger qucibialis]